MGEKAGKSNKDEITEVGKCQTKAFIVSFASEKLVDIWTEKSYSLTNNSHFEKVVNTWFQCVFVFSSELRSKIMMPGFTKKEMAFNHST